MQTHFEIYNKISSLFNLKFKSQISNLELEFESFYLVKNIITESEHYVLIFNNERVLKFKDKGEFLSRFSKLISNEIEILNSEYSDLQNTLNGRFKIDVDGVFIESERIGHNQDKLDRLFKKLILLEKNKM